MIATGPSCGAISWNMVEKLAIVPVARLAMPWQFGPIMRMPAARAVASM